MDRLNLNDPFDALIFEFIGNGRPPGSVDTTPHILCQPDDSVPRTHHKHLCSCGTCWAHDDMLNVLSTTEEFETAHACPSCGTGVREKHWP